MSRKGSERVAARGPRVRTVPDVHTVEDVNAYVNAIKEDITEQAISKEDQARHLNAAGKFIAVLKLQYRFGTGDKAA